MNVDAVFRMPFGSRLCIAAGPAAVCFPEPDRLLPTAVVCRAFTAPGRGHLSASFFIRSGLLSCRISLCGEPVRSSTAVRVRLSARLSAFLRSGFSSRPCCLYSAYGSLPGCILLWFGSNRLLDCLLFCGPAPTACPMIRSLAARIYRLSDCPLFCGPEEAAPPLLSCGLTRPPLFSNACGC